MATKKSPAKKKETSSTDTGAVRQAQPEELDISFSGPAVLANRCFVNLGPAGARITFTEQREPELPVNYRAAVILSYQDAISLWKLMERMLSPIEQQLEAAKQAGGEENGN